MFILNEIKGIILDLCADVDDDSQVWQKHIESVVFYSKKLARELNADEEICGLSAWLHDIKKLRGEKGDHHIFGAQEAEQILVSFGYPKDRIDKVKGCILCHSSDEKYSPKTIEEKIVACADGLSLFDNFLDIVYIAYVNKKYSVSKTRSWLKEKYEKVWKKISILEEAKTLAGDKHSAIMLILEPS